MAKQKFIVGQWVRCLEPTAVLPLLAEGMWYRVTHADRGQVRVEGIAVTLAATRFTDRDMWVLGADYRTSMGGVARLVAWYRKTQPCVRLVDSSSQAAVGDVIVCHPLSGQARGWDWHLIPGALPEREVTATVTIPVPAEATAAEVLQTVGLQRFATGAVRGTDANDTRYDLISPHILTALAATYAEGSRKYGDTNWLRGIPSQDLLNHALRHLVLWQQGDDAEDHLAHAIWNLGSIIHFQKTRPELVVRQYALPPEHWLEGSKQHGD